ncbi:hypothetical protein FNV43_RR18201 [Rhamnella rubrinervis]|uniref:Uncharacterized protein n=1 Tax=Rhamnella rubrinervis TaxID=2594499 RepID=A0A8K0E4Q3_9ROSA|nr:hypothetical protein FNV43_RR18201 [Rhamnella rubrinervis]
MGGLLAWAADIVGSGVGQSPLPGFQCSCCSTVECSLCHLPITGLLCFEFHRKKTLHMKRLCQIVRVKYSRKCRQQILLGRKLRGIAKKMAF